MKALAIDYFIYFLCFCKDLKHKNKIKKKKEKAYRKKGDRCG